MEKETILIIEEDEAYGEALCKALNGSGQGIAAERMTLKELEGRSGNLSFNWYFVNEKLEEKLDRFFEKRGMKDKVFLLTEIRSSYRKDFARSLLFKYQTPNRMLELLSEKRRIQEGEKGFSIGETAEKSWYGTGRGANLCSIFSAREGCGTTSLAVGLTRGMAMLGKRSLYLNLEPYPTRIGCKYHREKRNGEELAYRLIYGREEDYGSKWELFLGKDEAGASYLYFQEGKNPLLALEEGEMEVFLNRLREKGPFDCIFLDAFKLKGQETRSGKLDLLLEKSRQVLILHDGTLTGEEEGQSLRKEILRRGYPERNLMLIRNKAEDPEEKGSDEIRLSFDREAFGMKGEGMTVSMEGPFGRDVGKLARFLQSKLWGLH